jgi:hypothetical protein
MPVYFAGGDGTFVTTTMGELMPMDSLHGLKNATQEHRA